MLAERLDFLMKATDTKNSALGRALSFDPSYIGRIRSGKRGLPKQLPFVEPAAAYFARNIKTEHQRELIQTVVFQGNALPESQDALTDALSAWLAEDAPLLGSTDFVTDLLQTFATAGTGESDTTPAGEAPRSHQAQSTAADRETTVYYYGNAGKRDAVRVFLDRLLKDSASHDLLLFSDEDMSWLYEDPAFAGRWAASLIALLQRGSRIRIIHSLNRDLNELMEAVRHWLPLYAAGDITPYYYPRLRDGVYHRTLFLAAGQCAVISDSIGTHTEGMPNLLLTDQRALKGLALEFDHFLSLCMPLMNVYRAKKEEARVLAAIHALAQGDTGGQLLAAYRAEQQLPALWQSHRAGISHRAITLDSLPPGLCLLLREGTGALLLTDHLVFDILTPQLVLSFSEYVAKL